MKYNLGDKVNFDYAGPDQISSVSGTGIFVDTIYSRIFRQVLKLNFN